MRIISGTARGKKLVAFKGEEIRPTPDRVREAVFSILLSRLGTFQGKNVLDLFAGTGAMGLEALSRGAGRAVLIDQDAQANRLIKTNLDGCALAGRATVIRGEVLRTIPRIADGPFDLIFLDPPYGKGLLVEALKGVDSKGLLAPGGIVCAESDSREELPDRIGALFLEEKRRYGSTAIHIFTPEAPAS